MPVRRFRAIDDAPQVAANALDPRNLRVAFDLSELCLRLAGVPFVPGVQRFRSITEARDVGKRSN